MKKLYFLTFIMILVLIPEAMAEDELKLTIIAEKTEFLLGEPIAIYVTLTNIGFEPIKVIPEVRPEVNIYYYYITDPEGNTKSFSPIFIEEPDEIKNLQNNESIRGSARIFFGSDGYYFPKPGDYTVFVHYQNIKSQPLRIKILFPQNEAEREQVSLILDHPEVGLFLVMEGGDELADALAQIEKLTGKYPNSILSSYLQYALAKNYSVPARNFVSKKPRDANPTKAIDILQSIKNKDISLFYRNKVFKTLSFCLDKVGRKEEARKVTQEFREILEKKKKFQKYFIKQGKEELKKLH